MKKFKEFVKEGMITKLITTSPHKANDETLDKLGQLLKHKDRDDTRKYLKDWQKKAEAGIKKLKIAAQGKNEKDKFDPNLQWINRLNKWRLFIEYKHGLLSSTRHFDMMIDAKDVAKGSDWLVKEFARKFKKGEFDIEVGYGNYY
jgi:hypothetical protein